MMVLSIMSLPLPLSLETDSTLRPLGELGPAQHVGELPVVRQRRKLYTLSGSKFSTWSLSSEVARDTATYACPTRCQIQILVRP